MQHSTELNDWQHSHDFLGSDLTSRQRKTTWVTVLTLITMVAELVAGWFLGSMALLADGWHMGSHAAAIGTAAFAYHYAQRHANDPRFSFGTGKVNALAGFASAIALGWGCLFMAYECTIRLLQPVSIRFDEAMLVAALGLLVNLVGAKILHEPTAGHVASHSDHSHGHAEKDHNLRGAYLHVLADVLMSVLAIIALVVGKYLGWFIVDPVIGIVGSLVILRWSISLFTGSGRILLDAETNDEQLTEIRERIETGGGNVHVSDLHMWRVGPRHFAVIVSIVAESPRLPNEYKALFADRGDLAHITVEVHPLVPPLSNDPLVSNESLSVNDSLPSNGSTAEN